jgi:hypothetical protein
MSTVFVTDIQGSGVYAVPGSDAALAAAQLGLGALLAAVPSLTYDGVYAFVKTTDGISPSRTLCCLLSNAKYGGVLCPSPANTQAMTDAIAAALVADPSITSVSVQDVSIVASDSAPAIAGYNNIYYVADSNTEVEDGSFGRPFREIADATSVAVAGDLVVVYPGLYKNGFLAPDDVDIKGMIRDACIIIGTGQMITWAVGYNASVIRGLTFHSTPPVGSPAMEMLVLDKSPTFEDCKFSWSGLWHQNESYISADDAGNGSVSTFRQCIFDDIDFTVKKNIASDFKLVLDRCIGESDIIFHGLGGEELQILRTQLEQAQLNCVAESGSMTVDIDRSYIHLNLTATPTVSIEDGHGTTVVRVRHSDIISQLDRGLYIATDVPNLRMSHSRFSGPSGDIYVEDGYRADAYEYDDCVVEYGGVQVGTGGFFNHIADVLHVGGNKDCFYDLQDALDGLSGDGHTIQLHKDITLSAELTLSNSCKIDGMNKHSIVRAKHDPIMVVASSQEITFDNVYLEGALRSTGGLIRLLDNVEMEGECRLEGDLSVPELYVQGAQIVGDVDNGNAVQVNVSRPSVLLRGAKLKGAVSRPAIEWTVVNDNIKLEYTKAIHGLGGNPFSITVPGPVSYASHHCAYNSDPQTGGTFVNAVVTPLDVIDPAVDF